MGSVTSIELLGMGMLYSLLYGEYFNEIITGWWFQPLKNMTWDDDIPNIWKNKKYSKPPTSMYV